MRINLVLAVPAVSALALTAAAFSPDYLSKLDQRPLLDLDESAPIFDLDEDSPTPVRYVSPFIWTDEPATIYGMISNDERFTRLTKAINFVDGVAERLDDENADLTFFAPPDEALRRPGRDSSQRVWPSLEELSRSPLGLPGALAFLEDVEAMPFDDEHDKERRKKILKIIIRALLEYHIIPTGAQDISTLGMNQTFPTNLTIPGTLDHTPQRLRVQQKVLPPATFVNFYSRITSQDRKASNGIVHVVDRPLIPPPSVFEGLYLFPHFFSTFTSVLQRSNLTDEVDLRYIHKEGWRGSDSITVFAPTNQAFDRLPHKLQLYLFSPFGARALKKLVQYHVAPDVILFTDFVHFDKREDSDTAGFHGCACAGSVEEVEMSQENSRLKFPSIGRFLRRRSGWPSMRGAFSSRELVANLTYNVDTLFSNHSVRTQILKNKITFPFPGPKKPVRYETKLFVNGRQVPLADIPARNGVVHVVPELLNPHRAHHKHPHHKHPHHPHRPHKPHKALNLYDGDIDQACWEDWEDWLPQWVDELD